MELVGGLDDDEGRAGDQVMGLEQAADRVETPRRKTLYRKKTCCIRKLMPV
jgi:hypothetical protein